MKKIILLLLASLYIFNACDSNDKNNGNPLSRIYIYAVGEEDKTYTIKLTYKEDKSNSFEFIVKEFPEDIYGKERAPSINVRTYAVTKHGMWEVLIFDEEKKNIGGGNIQVERARVVWCDIKKLIKI